MKVHSDDNAAVQFLLARTFAVLDVTVICLHVRTVPNYIFHVGRQPLVSTFLLLALMAVSVSAVLWWQLRPGRFIITYLLFPIRIWTASLSFAWLAVCVLTIYPSTGLLHHIVWCVAIALELVRLVITVRLHFRSGLTVASDTQSVFGTQQVRNSDPYRPPSPP